MNEKKIKKDIVESIYEEYGYEKNTVSELYSLIFDKIKEELCNGNTVIIKNFGLFNLKLRKGKKVHNPKTGEILSYDSHFNVSFKPGKEIKERIKYL